MNSTQFFAHPGDEPLARALASLVGGRVGRVSIRDFPDGEQHLRLEDVSQGDHLVLVTTQTFPTPRLLPFIFLAASALALRADCVGLVAPYLSCLREDRRTRRGAGGNTAFVATLLSASFDWIVTVSPQLQRSLAMERQFSVPLYVVESADAVAAWVRGNIVSPLIVGPMSGPEAWPRRLARELDAPHLALIEHIDGASRLQVSEKNAREGVGLTPVVVRSVIETETELRRTIEQVRALGYPAPTCVATHPVLVGNAYAEILAAGAGRVASCNTIAHQSNAIDLAPWIAEGVLAMMRESASAFSSAAASERVNQGAGGGLH